MKTYLCPIKTIGKDSCENKTSATVPTSLQRRNRNFMFKLVHTFSLSLSHTYTPSPHPTHSHTILPPSLHPTHSQNYISSLPLTHIPTLPPSLQPTHSHTHTPSLPSTHIPTFPSIHPHYIPSHIELLTRVITHTCLGPIVPTSVMRLSAS